MSSRILQSIMLFVPIMVMVGHFIGSSVLVQVLPNFVPMQFNTAFCFLMCALFLREIEYKMFQTVMLAAVTLISGLTLIEYFFRVDIGIDQMFWDQGKFLVDTSSPGRMSPLTALGFLIFASSSFFEQYKPGWISLFLVAIPPIIGYALFEITGEKLFFLFTFLKGSTFMAIHTAVLFVILGVNLYNEGRKGSEMVAKEG